MTLQVVGAGLGRTGTLSLKLALEQLLGGPCYHMLEVFGHPEHVPLWRSAIDGSMPDWDEVFDGYRAAVDWPVGAFWRELMDAYPDALVLLSTRPADEWWRSADRTIFEAFRRGEVPEMAEWHAMAEAMLRKRFVDDFLDQDTAIAAFEQHNADVRASVPPDRLLDWTPGDGWKPLCDALDVPVPGEPFPHANTTEEFRARTDWD
jgi:hypothetical protein